MANIGYATLQVIPSMKGFGGKLRTGLSGPLLTEGGEAGKKAGRSFASTFAKFAVAGAAATGAVALGKGFIDAAIESQKVGKQTEAVLKSMGTVAGLTAKDVGELSTKLSLQSGVDDEVIQGASNVLLTFGQIRNKIGKGNDIFDRAQTAALDMSVAMGQDLQGATVQVGKALNDPIKGLTALSRVGVSFTTQQQDQVKALVKSGKTLDAQKLILGELEHQFKGSAAAQATAGEKLKVVFGNLQEQLGGYLLPVVEKVANFLAKNLPNAIDATTKALRPVVGAVKQIIGVLFKRDFTGGGPFEEDSPFIANLFAFRDKVEKVIQGIIGWVDKNWPKIEKVIDDVMTTVKSIISGAVTVIKVIWQNFGDNILDLIQRVWPRIQQIIEGALKIIRSVVKVVTSLIQGDWAGVWEGLKGVVSGAWEAIQGIVLGALDILRSAVGVVLEVIGSVFKSAWEGISSTVSDVWGKILDFFRGVPGVLASIFGGVAEILIAPYRAAFNAIAALWNNTIGKLSFHLPGWIPGIGGKGFDVPDIPTWGGKGTPIASRGDVEGLRLARGGIVKATPGGIWANIGEGRYDEAVIPLRPGMAPLDASHAPDAPESMIVYLDGKKIGAALRKRGRTGAVAA